MWVVGKVLLLGVCNLKCKLITLTLIRAAENVLAPGYHRIVYPPSHTWMILVIIIIIIVIINMQM